MKKAIILSAVLLSVACRPNLDYELHGYTQKIIVEGFISTGDYAHVYLSLNNPAYNPIDSANVLNNVIRTAKVTVSDGENVETLTSQWNKERFPPYVYRSTEITGVEGKTYYLTVEYSGHKIHAATTVPHASEVEEFIAAPVKSVENMRTLTMNLRIKDSKNGFRVFTKKTADKHFTESPFVYNENLNLMGNNYFLIAPRPSRKDSSLLEGSYFRANDSIKVRVCSIDSTTVQFFKSLTLFSESGMNGRNIFIGENKPLASNISRPGFGIWYGIGVRNYEIKIK